MKTRVP